MKRRAPIAIAALSTAGLLMTWGLVGSAQGGDDSERGVLKARLSGLDENPSVSSTGSGEFRARIDDAAQTIEYEFTYRGLEGGASLFAHVHFAARRVNGGVMFFLCGGGDKPPCPPVEGTITGTIDPADIVGPTGQGVEPGSFAEAASAMRAGYSYANIHTTRWPGGEIRGQVRPGRSSDD